MTESTALAPIVQVREELAPMKAEFGAVLPSHINADKFMQVCITALENNPDLLRADRQSFKVACLNAANDGLLPDKREGAFVIFNTEVEVRTPGRAAVEKRKVPMVQWMPMITGILKKAYQTGKVGSISVELVHKNDVYRRAAGDNAEIVHEPLDFGDRGEVIGGYAIIRMTDGSDPAREVMSMDQITKVRNVSRSKDRGPWVSFFDEMAKKTILRRALKRVPLSAEMDQVLSRDDAFYNLSVERHAAPAGLLAAPETRKALFSDKSPRRQKPAAAVEPPEAAQEPVDAGPASAGAGNAFEAALGRLEAAAQIDSAAVDNMIAEIEADPALQDLSAEESATLIDAMDRAVRAAETPAPEQDDFPGDAPAPRDADFSPTAIINSTEGATVYQDAAEWRDDILAKMSVITGPAAVAFWKANRGFVRAARDAGVAEALRVIEVGAGRNLPVEDQ